MPECVLQQYRAVAHTDFISVSPPHGTHIREVKLLGDIEYCSSWCAENTQRFKRLVLVRK